MNYGTGSARRSCLLKRGGVFKTKLRSWRQSFSEILSASSNFALSVPGSTVCVGVYLMPPSIICSLPSLESFVM